MQHDHHCLISFHERDWRIERCSRDRIYVKRYMRFGVAELATIDTSRVDWDEYTRAAVQWDYMREKWAKSLTELSNHS